MREAPGAGRITLGSVKAQSNDKIVRSVITNDVQSPAKFLPVCLIGYLLSQGEINIVSQPCFFTLFLGKAGEIRVGKGRMPVNGNSHDIIAPVKYLLLTVAVMIVYVKYGHLAGLTEI